MKKKLLIGIATLSLTGSLFAGNIIVNGGGIIPGQNPNIGPKCPYSQEECQSKKLNYNHSNPNLSEDEVNYMKYMIYKDKVENKNKRHMSKDEYLLNKDKIEGFRDDFREEMRNDKYKERFENKEQFEKMNHNNMR